MPQQICAKTAAVATHHPHGAAAGLEMLHDSGNAVDAAVAAMLALCVVVPGSVGLGGYGGSAIIYLARQRRVVAIDFDSRAPLEFRDGLITAEPQSSSYGARSVTVPAVVAGLDLLLREFGTKSWSEASQTAIQLAEGGFTVDSEHRRFLDRCGPKFDTQSLRSLFPAGKIPEIGDCWKQPETARLLRRLAENGPNTFYVGEIAQTIIHYLRERGGILTERDFQSYRPRVVAAINTSCREFDLYTPPPPSGGITSLGIIQTLECLNVSEIEPWSGPYFHLVAEAMKLGWLERSQHLGDPDFVDIPMEHLISHANAAERAEQIRNGQIIRRQNSVNPSPHTSNVIAVDGDGNLISVTATQGWMYGSHLVVDGLGLVLNHGMSRFDYSPGHPNAPAANKRMQHNMSPMIALKDGRPAFAVGMPGGPKIVSVTAQLALDLIAFGATPAESIAAPRLHSEGCEPLLVSSHMPAEVVAELEQIGHNVRCEEDMGGPVNVLTINQTTGTIDAAAGESTGAAAGF